MVAYLLILFGLIIITSGIAFSFIMDTTDAIIGAIGGYQNTPLAGQLDSDSIQTGDMLYMVLSLSLLPVLICLIYWVFTKAQKPVQPY